MIYYSTWYTMCYVIRLYIISYHIISYYIILYYITSYSYIYIYSYMVHIWQFNKASRYKKTRQALPKGARSFYMLCLIPPSEDSWVCIDWHIFHYPPMSSTTIGDLLWMEVYSWENTWENHLIWERITMNGGF